MCREKMTEERKSRITGGKEMEKLKEQLEMQIIKKDTKKNKDIESKYNKNWRNKERKRKERIRKLRISINRH